MHAFQKVAVSPEGTSGKGNSLVARRGSDRSASREISPNRVCLDQELGIALINNLSSLETKSVSISRRK